MHVSVLNAMLELELENYLRKPPTSIKPMLQLIQILTMISIQLIRTVMLRNKLISLSTKFVYLSSILSLRNPPGQQILPVPNIYLINSRYLD